MIIELLTQKGFVQGVDYSYENGELVALEQIRMVTQINEETQEEVEVEEAFYADLPSLESLKLEAVRQSDPALLISEYLKGKPVSDDDSLNIDLFLSGAGGWRFAQVPAPSMEELFDFIQPVQEAMAIEQAKQAKIQAGRQARVVCETVLDFISGFNLERELSLEQITSMAQTFGAPLQALQTNRPSTAKTLIQAIVADEVLVTQEMLDECLALLADY